MNKHGLPAPNLLKRDERLRIALEVSQIAVWDWDVNSNLVFYSQQWKRLRGISGDESYDCPDGLFDLVHPDEKSKREALKSRWLEGHQDQFHSEYRVEHESGAWVRVSERVKVVRDNGGNVVRLVGAVTEILQPLSSQNSLRHPTNGDIVDKTVGMSSITDRKKLEQQQEQLIAILESTSDFICIASVDCKMLWCNQRFSKLRPDLDPSRDVNCMAKYSPSSQEIIRDIALPSAIENGIWSGEITILDSEGEEIPVSQVLIAHKAKDGSVENFSAIMRDVRDLKKASNALHETQNHLQVMTDNIPSMLYRFVRHPDGTQEFPFVSSGARDFCEVEPEVAMKDSNTIFERIHPDDLALVEKSILESYQNLTPFKVEYRVNLPEKGLRWLQAMSNPTPRDDGTVFWDGLAIDITQRKEAEIELEKVKMKDEFLANVSHELRTPLNAMLGMTEGLQEGVFGPVTLKQLESLKIIEQSGDHLLGLINEMLDFAKVESGQLELIFSSVEVRELCESSLRFVAHQADKKKIQLNLDLPFSIPKINLDEQSIRQVLINLLSNAVKFTPEGGSVSLKVERIAPSLRNPEGTLRTTITDTGIGIETAMLDSLFVPFVQVESSLNRNYEGTGLGLALVKKYVELHNGQIAVKSRLGVGSCFEFTLPFREPVSDDPVKPQPPIEIKGISNAGILPANPESAPLILLFEDNKDIALATSCFLEASGFRVLHETNGAKAVEMADTHSPNLILMDIQMPEVDGLDAMIQLRKSPQSRETPIIAVTGLTRQFDTERCLKAGANEFLSKPYRMGDLVKTIQKLLEQQASVEDQ